MESLLENQDKSQVGASASRRTILLLASRQAMYQSLAETFQQHFPAYDVVLADGRGRLTTPSARLGLILVSARTAGDASVEDLVDAARQQAPGIPIGLLIEDDADFADFTMRGVVQGVLRLSLPLDVLIAVSSLLLAGGVYLPQERDKQAVTTTRISRWETLEVEHSGKTVAKGAMAMADSATLTTREEQILKYVSEGFQNKLIANRMALSEHTVKAHVHKVITKLGVSNRTQAAAAFLRRGNNEGRRGDVSSLGERQS